MSHNSMSKPYTQKSEAQNEFDNLHQAQENLREV